MQHALRLPMPLPLPLLLADEFVVASDYYCT
jgi:hypothetical protein